MVQQDSSRVSKALCSSSAHRPGKGCHPSCLQFTPGSSFEFFSEISLSLWEKMRIFEGLLGIWEVGWEVVVYCFPLEVPSPLSDVNSLERGTHHHPHTQHTPCLVGQYCYVLGQSDLDPPRWRWARAVAMGFWEGFARVARAKPS